MRDSSETTIVDYKSINKITSAGQMSVSPDIVSKIAFKNTREHATNNVLVYCYYDVKCGLIFYTKCSIDIPGIKYLGTYEISSIENDDLENDKISGAKLSFRNEIGANFDYISEGSRYGLLSVKTKPYSNPNDIRVYLIPASKIPKPVEETIRIPVETNYPETLSPRIVDSSLGSRVQDVLQVVQ